MALWELFLIAAGLSMDAFAVSVCKGLAARKFNIKHALLCGVWFGMFQALMPAVGYFLGTQFEEYITSVDHWIAFALLSVIGGKMIWESCDKSGETADTSFGVRSMFPLAVATSIDALAVGITFAFLNVNVVLAVSLIGIITFILSALGVLIGTVFGSKYKSAAERVGGIVLVFMGLKILLDHTGILDGIMLKITAFFA